MQLFVSNLPLDVDEDTLRDMFSEYGTVDSVKVILDKDTGKSRGFGFIEMPVEEEARDAIEAINDSSYHDGGNIIRVRKAEDR